MWTIPSSSGPMEEHMWMPSWNTSMACVRSYNSLYGDGKGESATLPRYTGTEEGKQPGYTSVYRKKTHRPLPPLSVTPPSRLRQM